VSDAGLRLRNFAALFAVDTLGPCPQQLFARYLALTEPAAAKIVDDLVQQGFVRRGQDAADRRRYALELTDLGREQLAVLRDAMERLQAEVVETLGGPEDTAELHALIQRMLSVEPAR